MIRFMLAASMAAALAAASPARAEEKPIQLSLFDPVQLVPAGQSISGLSLALIYSKNANLTGVDFSFIAAQTTGNLKGVQLAPVDLVGGTLTGVQFGLFNKAKHVEGLQIGAVNYAGTIRGLQIGFVNIIEKGGWLPVCIIVNGNFG